MDKYAWYRQAVQDPENTCEFLEGLYRSGKRRKPLILREDFCGTFATSVAWVKRNPKAEAIGIDVASEPLNYGKKHHLPLLDSSERARLKVVRGDVLKVALPKADIVCAFNFSYFGLKTRAQLAAYFRRCLKSLSPGGVLVLDCLGVTEARRPTIEETRFPDFTYFWELADFNPITRDILFHIYFQVPGKKRQRAFRYDWRLWTLPELRELLEECGFRDVAVYWEDESLEVAPEDLGESWVAYLVARK